LRRPAAPRRFIDDARAWLGDHAAAAIRSLGFLEEPLAVWELDGDEGVVQLRSSPPLREGDDVTYWEVVIRCDDRPSATIARYHWAPGLPERERVIYPATFCADRAYGCRSRAGVDL
jgi:hypothetical protein